MQNREGTVFGPPTLPLAIDVLSFSKLFWTNSNIFRLLEPNFLGLGMVQKVKLGSEK